MPKVLSQRDLQPVLDAVVTCDEPLSLEQVVARLEQPPPRRTLQRRLAMLVDQGRLHATGERGGRRYSAPRSVVLREDEWVPPVPELPLSTTARRQRDLILRPRSVRRPVSYDTGFLTGYRPNAEESALLPESLRAELAHAGGTGDQPRPAGTHWRQIMDRLLIDLSWNSSRLEGNTYSLLETQRLLEVGESADGKLTEETQMLLNHKAAIELLADDPEGIGFNRYTICNLHALLADNLLPEPAAGGRLRRHAVGISGSVCHPLEGPALIEQEFDLLLAKAAEINNAFEQAFFIMAFLPYLQPFEDVNKRVSRLAANVPLVRHNLSPLSFVDVPRDDYLQAILAVYELNRVDYLRELFVYAYRRSCARYAAIRQSLGRPDLFRLRHREVLAELVAEVVRGGMDQRAAVAHLRQRIPQRLAPPDHERFMTLVETELAGLHEGNFARFKIRPSEFTAWIQGWR